MLWQTPCYHNATGSIIKLNMKKYSMFALIAALIVSCGGPAPKDTHPAYHNPVVQPFTDSIEAAPDRATNYYRRAEALSEIGQDSLALKDVEAALALDKNNVQYNLTAGYLQLQLDKAPEALRTLQHTLELSPGNVNVRLLLGKAYLSAGNPQAAEEQMSRIIAAAPGHIPARMMHAEVLAALKDTTAAIQELKSILKSTPGNYNASYQLADWYKASGNPGAIAQYQATFRMDTTNADPLFDIAEFYERQQLPVKAKEAYRICLGSDIDYTAAYIRIGKILITEDSLDKALRHFNLAVKSMPNSAEGYYNKGVCFEKLHLPDSARAAYRQAMVFDPGLEEAAEGLKRLKQ